MKFNFTPRNIAIAILLILTLILGIVSIIIATRLGSQNNNTISVDSQHGCQDFPPKNEHWCDFTNQCQEADKPCVSNEPPPGSNVCVIQYANGAVHIPNTDACSGASVSCTGHHGTDSNCSQNPTPLGSIGKGGTLSVTASCGQCAQIDCTGTQNGGSRVEGGACQPPPNNPPPVAPVCGDAKCKSGETCERTAANGTTFKLCLTADVTANRAPTGAASPTCNIATCSVPGVEPPPPVNPPPPPISTPLPSTAVISDDFDRILVGFMFVVLGLLAYRFNLLNRMFGKLNTLTDEDSIKNSLEDRYLKNTRGSFEKKVEKDFEKEK